VAGQEVARGGHLDRHVRQRLRCRDIRSVFPEHLALCRRVVWPRPGGEWRWRGSSGSRPGSSSGHRTPYEDHAMPHLVIEVARGAIERRGLAPPPDFGAPGGAAPTPAPPAPPLPPPPPP